MRKKSVTFKIFQKVQGSSGNLKGRYPGVKTFFFNIKDKNINECNILEVKRTRLNFQRSSHMQL